MAPQGGLGPPRWMSSPLRAFLGAEPLRALCRGIRAPPTLCTEFADALVQGDAHDMLDLRGIAAARWSSSLLLNTYDLAKYIWPC